MNSESRSDALSVDVVPPERYFSDRAGWDALVRRSGADPLFMGHAWQSAWWYSFGVRHQLSPLFLEVNRSGRVCGRIAFVRRTHQFAGITFHSLELLGNLWRGIPTFRSELLDLVAEPEVRESVAEVIGSHLLADRSWDLMVFQDAALDGALTGVFDRCAASGLTVHGLQRSVCFEVPVQGTFEEFRSSLSSSARHRLFGQRRKIAARVGPIRLIETSDLAELDRLHAARWGAPLLTNGREEFLVRLLRGLPSGCLHVSLLMAGSKAISALLNAQVDDSRLYNLQGGFDAGAAKSVSPARIHWGLFIEDVFRSQKAASIDLLFGAGRREDYKRDFAQAGRVGVSILVLRNRLLRVGLWARRIARRVPGCEG